MIAFEVGNKKYQSGRMSVFDQMVVAKRLMPAMKSLVTPDFIQAARSAEKKEGTTVETTVNVSKILPAIVDAIASLSDADAERVVKTTLKIVNRQNDGGAFSPVMTSGGDLLFDDISLPTMLQIVWKVIENHLGDFFAIAP